jgi:hypothetical protein
MAIKTFDAGERLFAADLNDNFDDLDGRTTAIENASLAVDTAGSNTVNLDFSSDRLVNRTATGAVTFTGSNYTGGKSVTVRVVAGASSRDLTFPADWKFVSIKPTALAANKVGVLATTAFGSAATDVIAAWAFED